MVPKWQVLENVVRAIEQVSNQGLPDLEVSQKAMVPMRSDSSVLREVDVLVRFRAGNRILCIGVEVKDESSPLDLVKIEGLWAKLGELDLDRRVVVSSSGFARTAKRIYSAKGLELVELSEVDDLAWAGLRSVDVTKRVVYYEFVHMHFDVVP